MYLLNQNLNTGEQTEDDLKNNNLKFMNCFLIQLNKISFSGFIPSKA